MITKPNLIMAFTAMFLFVLTGEVWAGDKAGSLDPGDGPIYFAVFEGNCKSLTIEGIPTEKECAPVLMVSKFQNGRAVFLLQQIKGNVITFHGAKLNEFDGAYQVDEVDINKKGQPATGSCHFEVTSQGSGALKCEATSDGERYSADFVINRIKNVLDK